MRKRVISILLAALMVVSLLPTVALATETAGLDNFKKVQTYTDGKFTDVKSDDWFEKNVSSAYELNLMVGKRNDFFDTESNLTVAEAMTIAARLRSIYYTGKAEFEQGDPWYQAYTDYCKANGVADPADYDLNKAITRGEFAEIFAKALPADALKKINTVQDNMIPDVKNSDKFSAAIYLLYRAGVLVGNDKKGTFAPDTNIKRVEVAAITTRMAQPALRESIRLVKPSSGGGSYTPPAPTTYTVTFDMQGHGTQIDPITNVASNAKITAPTPAPTADGYIFNGWYKTKDATTGELSDPWDFDNDTVTADITLYAEWAKTVADVLATVDGFPEFDMVNLKVPANAWARDGQGKMCIYNGSLCIFRDIYYFYTKVELNTVLTKGTNTWTCTNNYGETFTFNMDESVLTSVTLSGYTGVDPEINDTYAPIKMPQKGDLITLSSDTTHQYRVLSADGTKAFVMSMYDVSGTKKAYDANGTMSEKNLLQYKDSDIDKYLEETWYAGLNSTIKGAIEATTIDQPAYEWTSTDPGSGTYYAGTYDFESPEAYYIVPHSDKTAEVGERHAYLLDVKDVVDYLGAGNITPAKVNEMFFDTDSSTSKSCWLRSAYTDSISSAWNVDDYDGSLCYSSYNYTHEARAAFTIDLSKVDYDIVTPAEN